MSHFPIIRATFPDSSFTPNKIARRLFEHLLRLRAARAGINLPDEIGLGSPEYRRVDGPDGDLWKAEDRQRVDRRARLLHECIERKSGLSHLNRDDRDRLSILKDGVRLARIAGEHQADELAARLHDEMPWLAPATEYAWHAMRRSVREGQPGFRLPPVILDGPPGIGKTTWARRLGELIGATSMIVDATGEAGSFGIVGCQRGWSSARPGRALEHVLTHLTGNPVVVIDEVEKAGVVRSSGGQSYGLAEALLPLLETATAADWSCPYYRVRFDMSLISWILLTNSLDPLPEPLVSRCTILRLQEVELSDLIVFARREGERQGLSEASISSVTDALSAVAPRAANCPSLRTVLRMIDRAADLENRPWVV